MSGFRPGAHDGGAVETGVREGRLRGALPAAAGEDAAGETADDPRREAVLALKKANPEYGTRRIREVLRRFEAIGISESEVRRMLHEAKLLEPRPAPTVRQQPKRRFERAAPNRRVLRLSNRAFGPPSLLRQLRRTGPLPNFSVR
jgi:transposase